MTYQELFEIRNTPGVVQRVHGAMVDVASDILAPESGQTTERADWARSALRNPGSVAPTIVHYVLVENLGATVEEVLNADDTDYKSNVALAVDKLIGPAGAA